jgi:hypothetical protein
MHGTPISMHKRENFADNKILARGRQLTFARRKGSLRVVFRERMGKTY